MEEALTDVRNKYVEARENGTSLPSPFAASASPRPSGSAPTPEPLYPVKESEPSTKPRGRAVRSLFRSAKKNDGALQASMEELLRDHALDLQGTGLTNEKIVNEMLHDSSWALSLDTAKLLKDTSKASTLSSKVAEVEVSCLKSFPSFYASSAQSEGFCSSEGNLMLFWAAGTNANNYGESFLGYHS